MHPNIDLLAEAAFRNAIGSDRNDTLAIILELRNILRQLRPATRARIASGIRGAVSRHKASDPASENRPLVTDALCDAWESVLEALPNG